MVEYANVEGLCFSVLMIEEANQDPYSRCVS